MPAGQRGGDPRLPRFPCRAVRRRPSGPAPHV